MKKVMDIYGRELMVDESTSKIMNYSNLKGWVEYNARIIENGHPTPFFTDYKEPGKVDDIEQRMRTWDNALLLAYSRAVGFNASKNDPNNAIWDQFVLYVKSNESKFFTKNGDFRRKFVVDIESILNLKK